MKSVAFHNLGCKVNSYEIDVMQQVLQENGYKIVPFDTRADIYIVNTCSVTNIADRKSRQMLHQAKTRNSEAIVIATGCYVETGKQQLEQDSMVDLLIGNNRKHEIAQIISEYIESKGKEDAFLIDINHTNEYETMQLEHTAEHTRAYIKIQDGCNQFCSYCIIPYARGRVRSRKKEDILSEVQGLVKTGYQEIVLTGIHISSYGIDFDGIKNPKGNDAFPHEHLLDLLQELSKIEGLKRIRLGSLEPRIITPEFAGKLAALPKLCPHFHLSLQSGSDETLKRMNRHYLAGEYLEKVEVLRKAFNKRPAITTDVIVGFPGETEEEFEETKHFLKEVCFYEMHIFKYSKRNGTPAATMPNQVPDEIKTLRSSELLELEKEQSKQYRSTYLGKQEEVLFEETKMIRGQAYQIGHTREYVKVALSGDKSLSNQMMLVTLKEFLTNEIVLGEI